MKRSSICEYESDLRTPDASTLERLLEAMDFRWSALGHTETLLLTLSSERARFAALPSGSASTVDALRDGAREAGKAAAKLNDLATLLESAQLNVNQAVVSAGVDAGSSGPVDDPAAVIRLWDRLRPLAPQRQLVLVREDPAFWNRALSELLCRESEMLCALSAIRAAKLAELAVTVAEFCEDQQGKRGRLSAIAWAHLGNALRVRGDFVGANRVLTTAEGLWAVGGSDDTGFEGAYIPAFKASLRRDERRFDEALDLLKRAAADCRSERLRAQILVSEAKTYEERGDLSEAIALLRTIEVPEGEERILLCVRHNLADNLSKVGQFAEAEALFPEVRRRTREYG